MTPAIITQYFSIVNAALMAAKLRTNKVQRKFMIEIFCLFLSIPSRMNFLQFSRFGKSGEQRYRRQFDRDFDFMAFNKSLCLPYIKGVCAIAFDPSYIPKSGKHTAGVGYFWSGCAQASKRGLEILGVSVVDVSSNMSFHLEAVQTPAKESRKEDEMNLLDWYAQVLSGMKEKIQSITPYLVADAYFSKKPFVDKIQTMDLHLVSRLRDDAVLMILSPEPKTGKRGRPKKYGDKININQLDLAYFTPVENSRGIQAWTALVYCKSLNMNIVVVIEEFDVKDKKTRRILFSTHNEQDPTEVQDIYHTRFQMEFGFRDAKQYTGLAHVQARSQTKLYFHFNTALTAINIAKVMKINDEKRKHLPFSIREYKVLFYNELLLFRFIDMFGINPNSKKNRERISKLSLFGAMSA